MDTIVADILRFAEESELDGLNPTILTPLPGTRDYALLRVLDSSASKSAAGIAKQVRAHPTATTVQQPTGGVTSVQVLGPDDSVWATSPGAKLVRVVLLTC